MRKKDFCVRQKLATLCLGYHSAVSVFREAQHLGRRNSLYGFSYVLPICHVGPTPLPCLACWGSREGRARGEIEGRRISYMMVNTYYHGH